MIGDLTAPFFEIGPKNLMRRSELVALARSAAELGALHRVAVVLTVPAVAIEEVKRLHPSLAVFAQGMDLDRPGTSVGRVIAEALADAGADGVMLNHAARPLERDEMEAAVGRARGAGLKTMVCACNPEEARRVAKLSPTIILYEPHDLIGHGGGAKRPWISGIAEEVGAIDPHVLVMQAGGIGSPTDAFDVMRDGADGTGATSAVVLASDRDAAIDAFLSATREGWTKWEAGKGR